MLGHMPRRPGDYLLDRYFPNEPEEVRERVRERLQEYARWLIRVAKENSKPAAHLEDSPSGSTGDTMEPAHPPLP